MEYRFEKFIKSLLTDGDMYKILKSPLTDKMSQEVQFKCRNNLEVFFEEFKKMESNTKIQDFIAVSKDISEWIPRLLGDTEEALYYQRRFEVIFELLHLQIDDAVASFPMNELFLIGCCDCGLLTERRRDELIAKLGSKGKTEVKYQFLWESLFRKPNAYSLLLVQLYKSKTNYIEKFCDDLHKMIYQEGVPEREIIDCIMAYGESVVSCNMNIGLIVLEVNIDPIMVQYDGPQVSSSSPWRLHCSKCESPICGSQDIRVAQDTSYIIVNKGAYPKLPMKSNARNNSTVVCVQCEQPIGQVIKVDGVYVPTIKLKKCLLRSDTETVKCKKWKKSPFSVPVVTASDLSSCNSKLYTPM